MESTNQRAHAQRRTQTHTPGRFDWLVAWQPWQQWDRYRPGSEQRHWHYHQRWTRKLMLYTGWREVKHVQTKREEHLHFFFFFSFFHCRWLSCECDVNFGLSKQYTQDEQRPSHSNLKCDQIRDRCDVQIQSQFSIMHHRVDVRWILNTGSISAPKHLAFM